MAYKDPEKAKKYAKTYRDSHKADAAAHRERYRSDPKYREREREAQRERDGVRWRDPDFRAKKKVQRRAQELMQKYGLTPEQYDSMFGAQGGHCAICPATEPGGKGTWHVDHDHATGKVRGLLCHHCNLMLGNGKDRPEVLEAGAAYLRYHKARG